MSSVFGFHSGMFGFGGLGLFRILFMVMFVTILFVFMFNAGKSLMEWSKTTARPS